MFSFFLEGEGSVTTYLPTILMIVVLIAVMYFFMIRPQKNRKNR